MAKRAKNFSDAEKKKLLEIVKMHNYGIILDCKGKDKASLIKKNTAWKKIEKQFNSTNEDGVSRDMSNLRTLWHNIKMHSKKTFSAHKRTLYATGAGEASKLDDLTSSTLDVLGSEVFEPIQGVGDNDAEMELIVSFKLVEHAQ